MRAIVLDIQTWHTVLYISACAITKNVSQAMQIIRERLRVETEVNSHLSYRILSKAL